MHLCPADKTFVSPASSTLSQSEAHSRVHAARDLHVTASAQSKCLSVTGRPWLRVRSTHLSADFAHSLLCLRHGGRFRLARIIGHHVRERFVGSRAARSSEIRWLNVKQLTSTRLWLERDRTRSGPDSTTIRTGLKQSSSVQLSSRSGLKQSRARDVSCSAAHLSVVSSR